MGGVARSELAAAVSAAGAFGCLGMVRESPELITREVASVKARTDQPFGVNIIPSATEAALLDEQLSACISAGVSTLVFFWDVVPETVRKAKAAGLQVLHQVGSVKEALAAEAAGADAIIAQGVEAGGHIHGSVSSLVLLPLITQAVSIPVVGSGGFASGASLVAALALGAQGIHCGTSFLATRESFAHTLHKERVIAAHAEDTVHTDAFAINWPPGSPVRVLRSEVTDSLNNQLWGYNPEHIVRQVIGEEEGRPLYLFSTDSPLRSMTGDLDRLALFAGQVAGQINSQPDAGERVATIVTEAETVLAKLPS
jgi:nitronate monooxygenase